MAAGARSCFFHENGMVKFGAKCGIAGIPRWKIPEAREAQLCCFRSLVEIGGLGLHRVFLSVQGTLHPSAIELESRGGAWFVKGRRGPMTTQVNFFWRGRKDVRNSGSLFQSASREFARVVLFCETRLPDRCVKVENYFEEFCGSEVNIFQGVRRHFTREDGLDRRNGKPDFISNSGASVALEKDSEPRYKASRYT